MTENRNFIRLNVPLEVQYRVLESLKGLKATFTENVSESGMRLDFKEWLEPGTRLELTIRIPGESSPLWTIGRLVWMRRGPLGKYFDGGVEITHIKIEDRERLIKYALI